MRLGKKLTPFAEVKLSETGKFIDIKIPIDEELPLSISGKSHVVYTSRVPLGTGVMLHGKEVYINCTAFIEKIKGRE